VPDVAFPSDSRIHVHGGLASRRMTVVRGIEVDNELIGRVVWVGRKLR